MNDPQNNGAENGDDEIRAPKKAYNKQKTSKSAKKLKKVKKKDIQHIDKHPFWITMPHWLVRSSLYLVITLLCLVGLLWVKLQHGPLDLNFAKDRIEQALSNSEAGYAITLKNAELIWAEFDKPLYVRANEVIFNHQDGTELDIKSAVFGVSPLHLLKGEVRPTYIQITGPTIQLVEKGGALALFWRDEEDIKALPAEDISIPAKARDIRNDTKAFLTALFDKKLKGVYKNAQTLERISLKDIVILLRKEGEQNRYLGTLDLNLDKSEDALSGNLKLDLPQLGESRGQVTSLISYRATQQDLTFATDVSGIQADYLIPFLPVDSEILKQKAMVDGKIRAAFNDKLRLSQVQTDMVISEGRFVIPEITPDVLEVPSIALKASFDRGEEKILVETLSGTIDGIPFNISADGSIVNRRIDLPFTVKIAQAPIETLQKHVPEKEVKSTVEIWVTEKLSEGTFKDILLSGRFQSSRNIEQGGRTRSVSDIKASFGFDNMTVQYSSKLAPATQASGQGTYEDRTLNIVADQAQIGSVSSNNVVVDILNIAQEGAKGDVKIKANGPLSGAFEYLSGEPINLDKKISFKPKDAKGTVNTDIRVQFPLKKELGRNDFTITADGTIDNVIIPNVVKGLPLTGNKIVFDIKDNIVSVKGKGQFAQRPIDMTYQQNIGTGGDFKTKIVASIIADEGLRTAFGADLSSFLTGPVPINLNYVDQGNLAKVNIKGTLGPSIINVESLNYNKAPGIPGTFSLQGVLRAKMLEEINQLSVEAEGLKLDQGRLLFATKAGKTNITRGSIPVVEMGKTKTALDFEIMPNNSLKIIAKGPVLDASGLFKPKGEIATQETGQGPEIKQVVTKQPKQISLDVGTLILKDDKTATGVKAYFETDKQGDVNRAELDALIGKSQTVLRFKPDEATGKRDFFLDASDAGDLFRAIGFYKNIQGGNLKIYGQPLQAGSDNITGTARIDNFRAKDAPVLAQLVNALSLPGILGLLNNDGLTFSRLESNFEWRFRPQGDLIVLKEGRTSGSSLGLTFEGVVDRAKKTADISGTAIPASELNKMIGNIPLLGQILTGGDAFFAATYTIKGAMAKPEISVNPLSVLTPGIIRKILFEESVESKVKKAE